MSLREELEGVVGAEALLPDDGGPPVVAPRDASAAAALLKHASENRLRVQLRGAGRWSRRGAAPDVVLAAERLSSVIRHEAADLVVSVQAGMHVGALQESLARAHQWLPVDAPGSREGTIGGLVATSSDGPLRSGYGRIRDMVLGVEVVTGAGRVLNLGAQVVKNVAGYDVTRLFVGSFGSLGFITRVHLRTRGRPARDVTLSLSGTVEQLLLTAQGLINDPVAPAAVELISPTLARRLGGKPGQWLLLVRFTGNDADVAAAIAGHAELEPHLAAAWGQLGELEAAAPVVARLSGAPASLPELIAATSAGGADDRVAHLAEGVVRVLGDARSVQLDKLRGSLPKGATVHAWGPEAPPQSLHEGRARAISSSVRASFDPERILVAGWPFAD